jgi:predicted Zn-dependent peptidase
MIGITQRKYVRRVIDIIQEEINRVCTHPISKTDLNRIKKKKILQLNQLQMDNSLSAIVSLYIYDFVGGTPLKSISDEIKMVESLTADDLLRVSKMIFEDTNDLLITTSF